MNQYADQFAFILKKQPKEHKDDSNIPVTCRNCSAVNTILCDQFTANNICTSCGCLCSKLFNHEAEWRYYGYSDDNKPSDPARTGLPIDELLPKSSLTTKIKYTGTKYISLVRLHKWNLIHPEERSLFTVFKYMDKILDNLSITNTVRVQAKEYYKILSAKDTRKGTLTRGVIRKSFIAACIFVSCKNNNTPIQKMEIADLCDITKFDITKGFKKFSILERNKNIQLNKPNPNHMYNFIHQFCVQLQYTQVMEDIAHIIAYRMVRLKILQDTNDNSMSAGLLYYVAMLFDNDTGYRQTILGVIHTSIVTLDKIFKTLKTKQKYLLIGLHKHISEHKKKCSLSKKHVVIS